jgi:hypothetical protein
MKLSERPVDITRAPLADRFSGELDRRGDRRMGRDAGQPAQLIGAEAQDVVEAGIGALELERAVELALPSEHAGRELVREPAIALGEALLVAISSIGERRAGAHFAENL